MPEAFIVDAVRTPVGKRGGGLAASTDGLRFVVPVRPLYARLSPLYFGIGKRPRDHEAEHGLGQ